MRLLEECKQELAKIGISYGKISRVSLNPRFRRTYGTCEEIARGVYAIELSSRLVADSVSDQAVKDTLMHELLHTAAPRDHHGKRWKALADKVNRSLPAYQIQRTTSFADKGMEPPPAREARYTVACSACGREYTRTRMSKLIQKPYMYRCGACGGKLLRTK